MVAQINRLKNLAQRLCKKLLAGLCLAAVFIHQTQAEKLPPIISDDETEELLNQIIQPIFKSADVAYNPNKIFILSDMSLNAFVSDGNYMFIHTGTLINADNINQLSGIIAHETGHIAGGHIVRQKIKLEQMQSLTVASLIAAGAAAATSGRADAAMAVMLGSQSSILNSITAYQLQEERSADESAIKYLTKIGQSPQGLSNFMQKIQQDNRLNGYKETPYFRTHPMSIERQRFFEEKMKHTTANTSSPLDDKFKMIKAKLTAFLLPIERVKKLYPLPEQSENNLYAHAIMYYRENKLEQSINTLDQLIAKNPQNPYFYELKGQFLFERGKLKPALEAYDKALKLKPQSADMLLGWAQTYLELPHNKNDIKKIINSLNLSLLKRQNLTAWILLARAYNENGQEAEAVYASAQYSIGIGNIDAARQQIAQAEKLKPSASLQLKLNDLKRKIASQKN